MSNPFKPIAISLLPNFSLGDFWAKEVSTPPNMTLFESGRAAEYFLLKELGIGNGDEVIIQAFTCVAVPNSVIWTGAKPVFVDIDDSLNMDPAKLEKAFTKKTKAVIYQKTFGNLGQIAEVMEICKKHNVLFVEDCAHDFRMTGSLGFFSFGRDKVVSGLYGGGAIINNKIQDTGLKIHEKIQEKKLETRGIVWGAGQIFYVFLTYFVLNTYTFFNLGKIVHKLVKNFLPKVLTREEKQGLKPEKFYGPPSGVLAQYDKLNEFAAHRKKIAKFYCEQLGMTFDERCSYLRFNIFMDDPDGLRRFAAKRNIFLGDWYDQVVAPKGVDLEKVGYKLGSCSNAEKIAKRIVNLPTNPNLSLDDAKKVVEIVKLWKK